MHFLLKEFMESYPNIKILFREAATEQLQKLLIEDKLDFAFVFAGKEKSALSYLKLARQELVICCSRRHRFRRNNLLHLEEIKDEPLILPNSSSHTHFEKRLRQSRYRTNRRRVSFRLQLD